MTEIPREIQTRASSDVLRLRTPEESEWVPASSELSVAQLTALLVQCDRGVSIPDREQLSKGLDLCRSLLGQGSSVPKGWLLSAFGRLSSRLDLTGDAVDAFSQALAWYRSEGESEGVADALADLGMMTLSLGDCDKATERFSDAMVLNYQLGRTQHLASNLNAIGSVFLRQGDVYSAIDRFNQALNLYRSCGDLAGVACQLGNLSLAMLSQDKLEDAEQFLEESLSIYRSLGIVSHQPASLAVLAQIQLSQDRPDEAISTLLSGIAIAQEFGQLQYIVWAYRLLGAMMAMCERDAEAEKSYEEAIRRAHDLRLADAEAKSHIGVSVLAHKRGASGEAELAAHKANDIFTEVGDTDASGLTLAWIEAVKPKDD